MEWAIFEDCPSHLKNDYLYGFTMRERKQCFSAQKATFYFKRTNRLQTRKKRG